MASTHTLYERDGVIYTAVAQFDFKTREWVGYLLKEGTWFMLGGVATSANGALAACRLALYGVDADMGHMMIDGVEYSASAERISGGTAPSGDGRCQRAVEGET